MSDPIKRNAPATLQNSPLEELLGLIEAEAEAATDGKRAADLKVRAALLSWDGKGQAERALALLSKVDHPLAPTLRLGLVLAIGELDALAGLAAEARRRGDRHELVEVGTFLIWSRGSLELAAELFRIAADEGRLGRRLCLVLGGKWSELCELLAESRDPDALVEASAIAQDRLGDLPLAQKLAERAWERQSRSIAAVERLLELHSPANPEVLLGKLSIVGVDAANQAERAATQLQLAQTYEQSGALVEASNTVAQLCGGDVDPRFGAKVALRMRARLDLVRGEWLRASETYEQLSAEPASPALQVRYLRRAAQIADAKLEERQRAERLWARLAEREPTDLEAALSLVRLRVARNAGAEALAMLEKTARAKKDRELIQLVARARELLAGAFAAGAALDPALALWRLLAEGDDAPRADRATLESMARLYRRAGERGHLAALYRKMADGAEARRAAAYLSVAGALALDAGVTFEAEQCFALGQTQGPDDLLLHAGRALLHQHTGKPVELQKALEAMLGAVRSRGAEARLYRQLAQLALDQERDLKKATQYFEKALELQPDDWLTIYALAQLQLEDKGYARATELILRAATHAEGQRAAALLTEAAGIFATRLVQEDKAREAYERALEVSPTFLPALSGLADLHRKHGRGNELLEVLRRTLSTAQDRDAQLALALEIARLAETMSAEPRIALEAFRDVLRIEPGNTLALEGTARLCAKLKLWDLLLEAAERSPRSALSLRLRAEALAQMGRFSELVAVKESELQLLTDPQKITEVGREIAQIYEQKLGDLASAARIWQRIDEADPQRPDAARALQKLFAQQQRWPELAQAYERELQLEADLPARRRLELWVELGEVRKSRLNRPDIAAEAFEHALLVDASDQRALAALSDVYAAMQRGNELNRVLDLRAAASADPHERGAVLLKKGELLEKDNQLDGAFEAYRQSFELDPASRPSFTAYERACFRRERWPEALSLYDRAIMLVEVEKSRAYRLVDLYARKAQLLLQYLQQPGEAARLYVKVLELDPDGDAAQNALERIYSQEGAWTTLIALYEKRAGLVHDESRRSDILRRAARIAQAKLRDAAETARLYERLHTYDPTDAEALDALEKHYDKNRDWQKLVDVLRTKLAFTIEPTDTLPILARLARVYEEGQRDATRAIESYVKILEVDPVHREALEALSRLYESTERWAELIEVTRRLIRLVTDRAQKALLYFKCGSVTESKFSREDDAIRYYEAAIRTSPACLPAVHGLRDLHLRRKDWQKVIQSLELEAKLWTDDKERAGVFAHIGQIYGQRLDDEERAIQYYESALRVDAECLPANRGLFDLYFSRGEYARCVPLVAVLTNKVSREGDPTERSEFYRKRGFVAEKTHDERSGAEAFVVALEIWPENLSALDNLMDLARRAPAIYDFPGTFGELDRVYRKRNLPKLLARVLVAVGGLRDAAYDVEGAEQLYLEAFKLDPDEYRVVDALVSLHERWRRFEAGATVLEAFLDRVEVPAARAAARMRLAELYSDGAMDPGRAAQVLGEILEEDQAHVQARFRLAQEQSLRGQLDTALQNARVAVEHAAEPGRGVTDRERSRMHAFYGRLLDLANDAHAATQAYRQALDLDRACLPACIALCRRAAAVGDLPQTQMLIEEALRLARGRSTDEELELLRSLARFYVSIDEIGRAVDCYRSVLAQAADSPDDRIALGELLAQTEEAWPQAREELLTVVSRAPRYAPAYRALQQLYVRAGDFERAGRVAASLQLLGFSDPTDRTGSFRASVRRGTVPDDLKRAFLQISGAASAYGEALALARETLDEIYGAPSIPGAIPVAQAGDTGLRQAAQDCARLTGIQAEVFIADDVPGYAVMTDEPRASITLDAAVMQLGESERRFVLGRCFEILRAGCGLFTRLNGGQRDEVLTLLEHMLRSEERRNQQATDFLRALPKKQQKSLERLQTLERPSFSALEWLGRVERSANRTGLLASDDVNAAITMLATLRGTGAADGVVLLGEVEGGASLVGFFLSDDYHALRASLVA